MPSKMDELEDVWADILPPKVPKESSEVRFGFLWMGLLGPDDNEPVGRAGYTRKACRVDNAEVMKFTANFSVAEYAEVLAIALFTQEKGGEMVWRTQLTNPITLGGPDQFTPTLELRDINDEAARFGAGWRGMLKTKGIL